MANPYEEIFKNATGQVLNNSASQIGRGVLSTSNPSLSNTNSGNLWENLAAVAAQSLVGGAFQGYGQKVAADDLAELNQLYPQLVQDPSAKIAPQNVSSDVLEQIRLGLQSLNASDDRQLDLQRRQQQVQLEADPERQRGLLDVELFRRGMEGFNQASGANVPTASDASRAAKAGGRDLLSSTQVALDYAQRGIPITSRDAERIAEKANQEIVDAGKRENQLMKEEAGEIEADIATLSGSLAAEREYSSLLSGVKDALPYDTPLEQPVMPWLRRNISKLPFLEGTEFAEKAGEALAAEKTLAEAVFPKFGEIRTQSFPGSLTEREGAQIWRALPTTISSKAELEDIVNRSKVAEQLLDFEIAVKTHFAKGRGYTRSQLEEIVEGYRRRAGGSLIFKDPATKTWKVHAAVRDVIRELRGG